MTCFTVFDKKAGAYLPPFFLPNDLMATRTFVDCVNQDGHLFNKHPEDFSLYRVGTFDDQDGVFDAYQEPFLILSANSVIKHVPEKEVKQISG